MKKTWLFPIVLLFFLPPKVLAGKIVSASGFSFFEQGRELIAREKALDEAKRAAIEQAVGAAVESRTAVENFQVVKDQIFSRTSGYISEMKILEEKKSNLGAYEVKIEAQVEISALIDDLDRFQKILNWQKNPRLSIILEPGLNKDYLPAATKTANLLTTRLKNDGLTVFKHSSKDEIQMGLLVGLSLELSSKQTSFQGLELTLNEISLSANIYRPGDGEILATSSAVKSLPGENKLNVLDQGARSCVDAIWKDLRRQLTRLWEKELYSQRDIYLIIKKISSLAEAKEINAIFKTDVSGIVDANLISFRKGTAEYHLKYNGWPEQLANELQMSYFKNKYFAPVLENISGNKIIIKK